MLKPLDSATNDYLLKLMAAEDVQLLDNVIIRAGEYTIRLYGAGEKERRTGFTPDEKRRTPWVDLGWDAIKLTTGEYKYMLNVFKNWRYTEEL